LYLGSPPNVSIDGIDCCLLRNLNSLGTEKSGKWCGKGSEYYIFRKIEANLRWLTFLIIYSKQISDIKQDDLMSLYHSLGYSCMLVFKNMAAILDLLPYSIKCKSNLSRFYIFSNRVRIDS
jgi:hypothetical protein